MLVTAEGSNLLGTSRNKYLDRHIRAEDASGHGNYGKKAATAGQVSIFIAPPRYRRWEH